MSLRDEKRKNFFLNNTKSAKKNTKGTKQMERRGWRPEKYLCLLCSSLRFLCSSSDHSSAYPGAHGSRYRTETFTENAETPRGSPSAACKPLRKHLPPRSA